MFSGREPLNIAMAKGIPGHSNNGCLMLYLSCQGTYLRHSIKKKNQMKASERLKVLRIFEPMIPV